MAEERPRNAVYECTLHDGDIYYPSAPTMNGKPKARALKALIDYATLRPVMKRNKD